MQKHCKHCGRELELAGFERNLITRGKNKGMSTVKYFYKICNCKTKCTQ